MGLRMIMVALGGGDGVRGLVCNFFLFSTFFSCYCRLLFQPLYRRNYS